ncbi:hypothetical protein HYV43_03615 [Candidatus Micrarchaeota archaeon]|nr:hypothetical protein [Candidatus Micrarchaeota archaeon]
MGERDVTEGYLRAIVQRYADHINLHEQRSITELRELVSPGRPSLVKLAEKHATPEAAFSFVCSLETLHVSLPVSFWLTVDEMLALGAGDPFDKARLLCGLFGQLKKPAWLRVVLLDGGVQHALVWLDGKPVRAFDAVHCLEWSAPSVEEALQAYPGPHKIQKSVYEFSSEEYRELE